MSVSKPSGRPWRLPVLRPVLGALALPMGLFCATSLVLGSAAEAATIYTFSFVQTGYGVGPFDFVGDNATVSGTFSGTLDAGGYLEAANLTDYHLSITFDHAHVLDTQDFGPPDLFSYIPGDNGSLNIKQRMADTFFDGSYVCIGFAVGLTCGGLSSWRGIETARIGDQYYAYLVTTSAPVVTLVSAVSDTPPVATTPIPATLPLFVSALGGLGVFGVRRRKRGAAAPERFRLSVFAR